MKPRLSLRWLAGVWGVAGGLLLLLLISLGAASAATKLVYIGSFAGCTGGAPEATRNSTAPVDPAVAITAIAAANIVANPVLFILLTSL